ncbi:MAG: ABC transporter substrate-binding protein [Gammaproteobacteria bacterium]|nr:ABC transporter substrate-binding protein [Gammaproteobacteria bacterium]
MILRRAIRLRPSAFLIVLLGAIASATAGEAQTPHAMVETAAKDLLQVLEARRDSFDQDPDGFYRAVAGTLEPIVDFSGLARQVMGAYARKASDEQLARFAETLKWGLVRVYSRTLLKYDNEEIRVLPPRTKPRDPDRVTVEMEVVAGEREYPIEYSMRYDNGQWRVVNLTIIGANMALTYNSQFADAMEDRLYGGDLDEVIDDWAKTLQPVSSESADR